MEEKYLQSTLSGNIFFGSLDLYKSSENQQDDEVIGDANEGKLRNEMEGANIRFESKEPHMELPVMKSLKGKINTGNRDEGGQKIESLNMIFMLKLVCGKRLECKF